MKNTIEIIKSLTGYDLYKYKRRNSSASLRDVVAYDKEMKNQKTGTVFVSKSKEDLSQGKGFVVTSYETLDDNIDQLTHWTPNTFLGGTYYDFSNRIIKGHTKSNLKQINTLGYDIDTKQVDLYGLFLKCDELGMPRPNLILETPKGYQVFFVLDTPFYIHKNYDFKAIRIAERIHNNILHAIEQVVPVDVNCNPFGFFRIPRTDNVIYFNDDFADTEGFINWSIDYEKTKRKSAFSVVYGGKASLDAYTSSGWYKALLHNKNIDMGYYASSRNNALFTLALANYADEIPFNDAYDVLDRWNSALNNPLPINEFNRTLDSAYSGRYQGVKREYVDALLETWSTKDVSFKPKQSGWYKFAKPRKDRVRSHNHEWVQDIKDYIKSKTSELEPYFESSYRSIAEELNIPLSSFKRAIKNKIFKIKTVGRGRAARSFFAIKSTIISHAIKLKKQNSINEQLNIMLSSSQKHVKINQKSTPKEIPTHAFYHDTS